MDEILSAGQAYTLDLKAEWTLLVALGAEVKNNYLNGRCDPYQINLFISGLTNLYEILAPHVHSNKGQPDWAGLITEFDDWKGWVNHPTYFQSDFNAMFELRDVLAQVLLKLDILYFKKARA